MHLPAELSEFLVRLFDAMCSIPLTSSTSTASSSKSGGKHSGSHEHSHHPSHEHVDSTGLTLAHFIEAVGILYRGPSRDQIMFLFDLCISH